MAISQQSVLREAMRLLGLSRNKFSEKFEISRRRLDSWLLPDGSIGVRTMDLNIQEKIFAALRDKAISESRGLIEGTRSTDVPVVYCEDFDFSFPTLYRITYREEGVDLKAGLPDSTSSIKYGYALCEKPFMKAKNWTFLKSEPVSIRTVEENDRDWLYITEHRTLERADSYSFAILTTHLDEDGDYQQHGDFSGLYRFEGRIFSLFQIKMPQGNNLKDCVTKYSTDEYLSDGHIRSYLSSCQLADTWGQ